MLRRAGTARGLRHRAWSQTVRDRAEGERLEREEARARRTAFLSLHDNGDGTTDGRFRLPTLHAHTLKRALEALTSPQRLGESRIDPRTQRPYDRSTLFGRGLIELLEQHLDVPSLPGQGGAPFTVVVTMALEALLTGIGAASLDTGHRISAGEARRLAAAAGIIPMVLGGGSVPLDLGRERRLFSKHQPIALAQRYAGCAADHCDRPPSWVQVHHERAWSQGGRTDPDNGIPLCPPHHHMADEPNRWTMTRHHDGRGRFHRRQ